MTQSHVLQSENVLLLVIFQTSGVSCHHDGHSYVLFNGPLVSPTNCLLQLLQEIRYTTFSVVQSVFCLSLTVAPEDDFTVPAGVIILQH